MVWPPTNVGVAGGDCEARHDIIAVMSDITQILSRIESGDPVASVRLSPGAAGSVHGGGSSSSARVVIGASREGRV